MKPSEVPPVYEAMLDAQTYASLFRDLESLATLEVAVKRAAEGMADERERPTLGEAKQLLEQGSVRAVQVRYPHEDRVWIDTILRTPAGFRLVRMAALTP